MEIGHRPLFPRGQRAHWDRSCRGNRGLCPIFGLSGIREPIHALSCDLPLLAGAHLADDLVHRVAATLAEHGAELAGALADFRGFGPGTMARPVPCDYHTGAIRYYRERGIWPPG